MEKVINLVVDTGAFLRNSPLQNFGENIYTVEEVLYEVKSKNAKDNLQVLPYDIKVKEPEQEDLDFVAKFSRKTGDFFSLSKTDLKVIALAVCLEREKNGNIDHLKSSPSSSQIISNLPSKKKKNDIYGFGFKNSNNKNNSNQEDKSSEENSKELENNSEKIEDLANKSENNSENVDNKSKEIEDEVLEKIKKKVSFEEENSEEDDSEEDDSEEEDYSENDENQSNNSDENLTDSETDSNYESDDEGDWITPKNINLVKKQFETLKLNETAIEEKINTACITGDFSMQNVLMQIGIKVLSVEKGLLIKQTRQFVLRCIACYGMTYNTSSMFCPSCGNIKTLKKVSVSVNEKGEKKIHLNFKKPVTTKDVKLKIPRPRKGKYALNPILVPDQHVPKFKQSKFAIQEKKNLNNIILSDVGYLIRDNPFSINDVYSKSSQYKTGDRAAAINKMVFNEGRKYANKKKKKRRN